MDETPLPKALLQQITPRLPEMLSLLRAYVVTESPSLEKAAVDRCCAVIAKLWRRLKGARIDRIAQKHRGDHLRITWTPASAGKRPSGQSLALRHSDSAFTSADH